MADDLNLPKALPLLEETLAAKALSPAVRLHIVEQMDQVFGLRLDGLTRADLRVRPVGATIAEDAIESALAARKEARIAKDFARSDVLRDELTAQGIEVMDGDPLGWDWRLSL